MRRWMFALIGLCFPLTASADDAPQRPKIRTYGTVTVVSDPTKVPPLPGGKGPPPRAEVPARPDDDILRPGQAEGAPAKDDARSASRPDGPRRDAPLRPGQGPDRPSPDRGDRVTPSERRQAMQEARKEARQQLREALRDKQQTKDRAKDLAKDLDRADRRRLRERLSAPDR